MLPDEPMQHIGDLGCGSGLSTELLAARWPQAAICGVDSSPAMLRRARERLPSAEFVEADIATHEFPTAQDLLVANASLHWVGDHRSLLPRLLAGLSPGGYLAVQMPNNLDEPSHRLMREVAARAPYAAFLHDAADLRRCLLSPPEYYDCLAANGTSVTLWETRYMHRLDNVAAIWEWFSTTGLKPYLNALPVELLDAFRADYVKALTEAYPLRADGSVLLTLPRLFIVARTSGHSV